MLVHITIGLKKFQNNIEFFFSAAVPQKNTPIYQELLEDKPPINKGWKEIEAIGFIY